MDEPTTGLDPESRVMMWGEVSNLKKNGISVFLTTQYLDEADELADKIAILLDGNIVAQGTSSELKKMIPHGTLKLEFADPKTLVKAAKALDEFDPKSDKEKLEIRN